MLSKTVTITGKDKAGPRESFWWHLPYVVNLTTIIFSWIWYYLSAGCHIITVHITALSTPPHFTSSNRIQSHSIPLNLTSPHPIQSHSIPLNLTSPHPIESNPIPLHYTPLLSTLHATACSLPSPALTGSACTAPCLLKRSHTSVSTGAWIAGPMQWCKDSMTDSHVADWSHSRYETFNSCEGTYWVKRP